MTWDPINVAGEQPYPVLIGSGASGTLSQFLDGVDRIAVIHPTGRLGGVARAVTADLEQAVSFIEVPEAEAAKTPQMLARCWDALAEAGLTRSDAVIGFGGGTTTDLAGFAAATWLRGVKYIAMPTTLLAVVDAAVGGKTGVNLSAGKNLVGSFYEPFAVICDLDHLATLPQPELVAGMAELLKCGFIDDPVILEEFEADPDAALQVSSALQESLIRRAVAVKARVVSGDLRERTSVGTNVGRECLNYGHSLGHAIERYHNFSWRHGEAISVGMVFAAELALRLGLLGPEVVARHRSVLLRAGLPISHSGPWEPLRDAMNLDKKSRGASLRLVLLNGPSRTVVVTDPDEALLADAYGAVSS